MGAIGGMLGLGGGVNGTGVSGPSGTNILAPSTVDQANKAYDTAQGGLAQQQNFVNATQAQNGLGNQSNVYNQLQGVVNGTGPNPAQAQLAQATGANTANQAALMAGQRGSNANAGLIARQAAMQGGANQQNAAGQAATLQANQSLNALSAAGNMATQQAGQQAAATNAYTQASQNEQNNILNGIAGQNNANVGMQSSINSANASNANAAMQGQQGLVGGLMNGAGGALSMLAEGGKIPRPMYAAGVLNVPQAGAYAPAPAMSDDQWAAMSANPNQAPVQVATPAAAVQANAKANPAVAPKASGQSAPAAPAQMFDRDYGNPGANQLYKGASAFGSFLTNRSAASPEAEHPDIGVSDPNNIMQGDEGFNKEDQMAAQNDPSTMMAAKGGKVPAMVSPGERYLPPKEVAAVKAGQKNPMEAGEKIPGKPKVGGAKNSYANDVVPKDLDVGGLVLPRSVTQAKHPHWAAMKFVQAHMAKGGKVLPLNPKKKK